MEVSMSLSLPTGPSGLGLQAGIQPHIQTQGAKRKRDEHEISEAGDTRPQQKRRITERQMIDDLSPEKRAQMEMVLVKIVTSCPIL